MKVPPRTFRMTAAMMQATNRSKSPSINLMKGSPTPIISWRSLWMPRSHLVNFSAGSAFDVWRVAVFIALPSDGETNCIDC